LNRAPSVFLSRPRLRRAALVTLGAVGALLASEALLRAAYLSPGQYRLDPVLGVDRKPHSEVFVAIEGGARSASTGTA
jgi:hypothetical protein